MEVAFSKYSGCGNDFIVIDDRENRFPIDKILTRRLCHRQKGIGADGLVLLQPSEKADFRMRIFNADGSEAEMCGNGLRCLAQFVKKTGVEKEQFRIESMRKVHTAGLLPQHLVKISLGKPEQVFLDVDLELKEKTLKADYMDTGVPHAVVFVDHVDAIDVSSLGSAIRHHARFAPRGANANFVEQREDGTLHVRTFERGVEAETLACGTGLTACAIAAYLRSPIEKRLDVFPLSKERLSIDFETDAEGAIQEVYQTGPAEWIFSGTCNI